VQHEERVAKLIEWFVKAALRHAEAMESMQEQDAMVQVESMNRFYAAVKREGAVAEFLILIEHENPLVAGMAAVYAMREEPQRCSQTLKRLAKLPGMIGFRSQAALERWESGDWPE
jgi:hypothetical protein